mgnify:CR=1 FL=1
MYKKRWYDGLHDIYEGKDEFEIKFGCFGGDGGGSSGPTSTPDAKTSSPNTGFRGEKSAASTSPTTGFRGEQSAASPSNQSYSGPTGVGIGPSSTGAPSGNQTAGMSSEQAQANQNISENIAASISANQAVNNPANQAISDQFSALASAPTSSVSQNVSAVSNAPSVTGLSGLSGFSNYSGLNTGVPTGLNIGTPTTTQDVMAQATDVNRGLPGISIGPGTLAIDDFDPAEQSLSLGYRISYAKGGVVQQGIGSVFPYPRRR